MARQIPVECRPLVRQLKSLQRKLDKITEEKLRLELERAQVMTDLWSKGVSDRQMADELGISPQAVSGAQRRLRRVHPE